MNTIQANEPKCTECSGTGEIFDVYGRGPICQACEGTGKMIDQTTEWEWFDVKEQTPSDGTIVLGFDPYLGEFVLVRFVKKHGLLLDHFVGVCSTCNDSIIRITKWTYIKFPAEWKPDPEWRFTR